MAKRLGRHARMRGKIGVQAIGPGHHQLFQPDRTLRITGLQVGVVFIKACAQIKPDRPLALGLGMTPERGQIVGLNAIEVIFGLGVDHGEHRIRIGAAVNMGYAPGVAGDAGGGGLARPAGLFH